MPGYIHKQGCILKAAMVRTACQWSDDEYSLDQGREHDRKLATHPASNMATLPNKPPSFTQQHHPPWFESSERSISEAINEDVEQST